jgi:uncharacterized membrane protein
VRKLLILLSLFLFSLIKPQFSFAEVIHSFDTDIIAHKDGTMDVTETINYDFENESKHGIYRDIPLYSTVGNLYRVIQIKNIKVLRDYQEENFVLSNNSLSLDIKIGNANKTITGNHKYVIFYKVINGIGSNFEDHDEIYWNIIGSGWLVNIEEASGKVETDFDAKFNNLICFEGPAGSKNQTCNISNNTVISSQTLYPGSELTIVASYPVNTFPKSTLSKNLPQLTSMKTSNFFSKNNYIFIILNFIVAPYLIYWYTKHKNKKNFGSPAVNFDTPRDESGQIIRPALAGVIDNAKLEANDIAATIFDLAIRKYIKIEEIKVVLDFFPDIKDQKITKLKNADGNLNIYEITLFSRLFADGDSVNASDLKKDFNFTFSELEKEVFNDLVNKNYYTKNPKIQKIILGILAFFCLQSFNFILAIVLFFLLIKLNGRTELGDKIDFQIQGLKIFLKSMDRNYNWQAQNLYAVEQMIPYAIALGFINKFMEQLRVIYPNYSPTWYSGYNGSFYVGYAALYSGLTSSMSMTSTSSSGLSGGFSGGGGGGGGGGSW